MNFKKMFSAVLILTIFITMHTTVFADTVSINNITVENRIAIDGNIDCTELGISDVDFDVPPFSPVGITLVVYDEADNPVYIDQADVTGDGAFSFIFDLTDVDNSQFKAVVNTAYGESAEQNFVYENKSLSVLNSTFAGLSNENAIDYIHVNGAKLGINTKYFSMLSNKTLVVSEIKEGIEYSLKTDFKETYAKAIFTSMVKENVSTDELLACIGLESENLGNIYYLWNSRTDNITDDEKTMLLNRLTEEKPATSKKLEEYLQKEMISNFFKTTQYYADYDYIFENEYNLFGLTENQLTEYKNLGHRQNQALMAIYRRNSTATISTVLDLKKVVDFALEEANDSDNSSGSGGGGRGGSGSSVGSGLGGTSIAINNIQQTDKCIFNDVLSDAWYAKAVETLYDMGIVNGKGKGIFDPNAQVTREEFAQMLYNLLKLEPKLEINFADVEDNDWFYNAVSTLAAEGIVKGMETGFGVGLPITRQDMALMLCNTSEYVGMSLTEKKVPKDDEIISHYAKESVYAMLGKGILNGYEDGNFDPQSNLSRAEAAQALYSFIMHKEG